MSDEAANFAVSFFYTTFAPEFQKVIFDVLKNRTTMNKQKLYKIIVTLATALVTCAAIALGLNSCNVVRTITNKSEFYQRGDTSVMIQTKTTESYDASRKL